MKVTLRGGPEENDGEEIECGGGTHILKTVAYKTPSIVGICNNCADYPNTAHPIYKEFFNRKYEIRQEYEDGKPIRYVAWYVGEL